MKLSLNILQVIPFLTPTKGGSVKVLYDLSKQLTIRGHEVTIITTDLEFDNDYAETIKKYGVKVIPFHCIANISMFLLSPTIKKWLNTNIKQYDVIHMHNYRSYQNNIVLHYAKKYNVPYILQAHGSVLPAFSKQKLKKVYDFVWGKRILQNASKVIALTQTEADQYIEMGTDQKKITIVPNGIDFTEFNDMPPKEEFRLQYGINKNEKIILFFGRLHKIKGLDLLIDVMADLCVRIHNYRLVIVGPDDGYLLSLQTKINNLGINSKVLFTGPLYGRNKLCAYVAADVYVQPSIYEAFPMSVLEAIACGVPVVLTDKCCNSDIIKDGLGIVAKRDKSEIIESIISILKNDKSIGKEKIYNFKNIYNINNVIDRIEILYKVTS